MGGEGQLLDVAFPEPSSRLWRDKSSSRLAVTPAIYLGEGPGSDSRGGGCLCWADTAPARSQFWDPGHLVMERVCVQMISHTASPLPLPLGHEQHPSWKTGTKSETENSLAQTSSLEKPRSASLEKSGYKAISSSAYTIARSPGAGKKKSCFLHHQDGCGIKPDTLLLIVLQLSHFLSVPCQERIWPFHKVHVCKAIRNMGMLHDWVNLNL